MKVKKSDAHDRFIHFKKQSFNIGECCQHLIDQRPFGDYPFYIFAHARTEDNGVDKRVIWQPRLTKPKAQSNSMLFKVKPGSDNVKVIWILPAGELWLQFQKGVMMESKVITDSIYAYENNRESLEAKEPDDLEDWQIEAIYRDIANNTRKKAPRTLKQETLEASST